MNDTFRNRVFTPLIMPLSLLGGLLLYGYMLSRVMLAVDANVSVIVAVAVAGYVLLMAFTVERNRRISSTALGAGLVLALIGLVGAGLIGQSVGVREIHHEEEAAPAEGGEAAAAVEIPADALLWEADQSLLYVSAPSSGTAGEVTIAIDNVGGIPHNVTFEGVNGDQPIVEATNGIDVATIEIEPGTYTYYCSIPGHREAGMEGEITFS